MRLGDVEGSIESEPGHEFGMHVVLRVAADFPDTCVGSRHRSVT
jgi:hypothetical protein